MKQNKAKGDGLTIDEQILKECHLLYTEEKNGLVSIAEDIGIHLLAPRRKITVMLIGNHSAGKSTFINWYIEDKVQRTGAIETQGFTIVTSGKKRESLTGNATLHLYEHLQPLQNLEGVIDYMTTEITTSKQKKFHMVNFIDTPGLVDGDMKYPFDVNKAVLWLGENIADLIFVFFDPIGQALCKRTLNIVEQLSEKQADIMKFYLSKADDAGEENDRQRVLMQIAQEFCKRPNLNRTALDMPTIYVPNMKKESSCLNQIDSVCKEVEKTIGATIQKTLNTLERDCDDIADRINYLIAQDDDARSRNFKSRTKGIFFFCLGATLPLVFIFHWITSLMSDENLQTFMSQNQVFTLRSSTAALVEIWNSVPESLLWYLKFGAFLFTFGFLMFSFVIATKSLPTLPRRRKNNLRERRAYVQSTVKSRKVSY